MWPEIGKSVKAILSELKPLRCFYELEGPMVFTCHDESGDLLLAYQCADDYVNDTLWYLVVPFNGELEAKLTSGASTLRDALAQPRIWLTKTDTDLKIREVRRVETDEIPSANLPAFGAMLWPHLEPLLNVRAIGKNILETGMPSSVVTETVTRVMTGFRKLVDVVQVELGLSRAEIEPLYDLQARRLVFGSLEISLSTPSIPVKEGDVDAEKARARLEEASRRVSQLLRESIELANDEGETEKVNEEQLGKVAALQAISAMAPTSASDIQAIEVTGRFLNADSQRSLSVGKHSHSNAAKRLKKIEEKETTRTVSFRGIIVVVANRAPLYFNLKTQDMKELTFVLDSRESPWWAKAVNALEHKSEVVVAGKKQRGTQRYETVWIKSPGEE